MPHYLESFVLVNELVLGKLCPKVFGARNPHVDFCAVRPSNLVDAPERPSEFSVHPTLQNGIFNAGRRFISQVFWDLGSDLKLILSQLFRCTYMIKIFC